MQSRHLIPTDCLPAAHWEHEVLPSLGVYSPAAQESQLPRPVFEVYLPMAQGLHVVADAAEYLPLPHMEQLAEPELDHFPAGHAKHFDEEAVPITLLYLPAGQSEHPCLFELPYLPFGQDEQPMAYLAEYCPAAHQEQLFTE